MSVLNGPLFSNVSVYLCVSQRELLRHKQETRHIQAIKVNLKPQPYSVFLTSAPSHTDESAVFINERMLSMSPAGALYLYSRLLWTFL